MNKIAVIGSGTMGNGIAHAFAQSGFEVKLIDVSQEALDKAMATISVNLGRQVTNGLMSPQEQQLTLSRILTLTGLEAGVADADFVVEAATENFELKVRLFSELDCYCKPEAILASNTSSISITQIAASTTRAAQVIGMHFMNPVPVMKLVEVIRGYMTSEHTTAVVMNLARQLGKTPVEVNDYPGFVANRILMPMINEAIITLSEGIAGVTEIDAVMKLGMSHPMGPLQLADFIGLDVCLSILNVLHTGFGNPKYAACPLLVNMVAAGRYGRKSGEGFYNYQSGKKDAPAAARFLS